MLSGQRFTNLLFFKAGSTPSLEPEVELELTALRSRPEVRSRVRHLTELPRRPKIGKLPMPGAKPVNMLALVGQMVCAATVQPSLC